MFFPRLRRHAKWMFLFLALAFGLGFVAFGVGAGGIGIGDVFRNAGGNGIPSVSDAERRTLDNPKDAAAFRDLATAHQAAGNTDEAIEALERLAALRPRNADVLRELASLHLQQVGAAVERAQIAEFRASYLAPSTVLSESIRLGGRPLDLSPISSAVSSDLTLLASQAYAEAEQSARAAVDAYRRIVAIEPKDPSVRLELGRAAQDAGDLPTAIEAYQAFLRLAPDDPTAPEVRRLLRQLRAALPTG